MSALFISFELFFKSCELLKAFERQVQIVLLGKTFLADVDGTDDALHHNHQCFLLLR